MPTSKSAEMGKKIVGTESVYEMTEMRIFGSSRRLGGQKM